MLRRLTFGTADAGVHKGLTAVNSVVTDRPRLPLPKTRILGFLTYPICLGEILRFCGREKVPGPAVVTARQHPCRCLHVSRLVTDKARPGRKRNTLIDEINSNAHGFGSHT